MKKWIDSIAHIALLLLLPSPAHFASAKLLLSRSIVLRTVSGLPDPHCSTGIVSSNVSGPYVCCPSYCGECSDYPSCTSVRGQDSSNACCQTNVYEMRCGNAPANVCLKSCSQSVPPCIMEAAAEVASVTRDAGSDCNQAVSDWRLKAAAAVTAGSAASVTQILPVKMTISGMDLNLLTPAEEEKVKDTVVQHLATSAAVPTSSVKDVDGNPASVTLTSASNALLLMQNRNTTRNTTLSTLVQAFIDVAKDAAVASLERAINSTSQQVALLDSIKDKLPAFTAKFALGFMVAFGKAIVQDLFSPAMHPGYDVPCGTGEFCRTGLLWAMQDGIANHPDWYPGLNVTSTADEFQNFLFVTQARDQGRIICESPPCLANSTNSTNLTTF